MMSVNTYRIYFKGKNGNEYDEYFQALTAQMAADFAREHLGAEEIIEISKVVKNWR